MLNKETFQRLDEAIDKVLNPSKVNEGYNDLVRKHSIAFEEKS